MALKLDILPLVERPHNFGHLFVGHSYVPFLWGISVAIHGSHSCRSFILAVRAGHSCGPFRVGHSCVHSRGPFLVAIYMGLSYGHSVALPGGHFYGSFPWSFLCIFLGHSFVHSCGPFPWPFLWAIHSYGQSYGHSCDHSCAHSRGHFCGSFP